MKYVKLLQVTAENNNKFYEMRQTSDTEFVATYGRVGNSGVDETYPMTKWDKKYREKLKKGYQDITNLIANENRVDASLTNDEKLNTILRYLINVSRVSFGQTYQKGLDITATQVKVAQDILNKIPKAATLDEARALYLELFTTIPRQMSDVRFYLPKSLEQAITDVVSEQAKLDNASIQHSLTSNNDEENLLDKLGVEMQTWQVSEDIIPLLGNNVDKVKSVIKLHKPSTAEALESYVASSVNNKRILAWHGTAEQNVLSICALSLQVRPTSIANGSMLGVAAYISDDFEKSYNYIRGDRKFMFIFEAHVGNELVADTPNKIRQYTLEELVKLGYDSVYAPKGVNTGWANLKNSERTIYRSEQLTPRYLLEVK